MAKERKIVKRWKSVSDFTKAGVNLTDGQKNFILRQGSRFWVGGDTAEDALKSLETKIEKSNKNALKKQKESEQQEKLMKSIEELTPIARSIQKLMDEKGISWQDVSKLIVDILNQETNNKIKEAEKQLEELKQNLIK